VFKKDIRRSVGSKEAGAKIMSGKIFVRLLPTLLLITVSLAQAQQAKKIPRIGYLAADPQAPTREAFRQGLRDLGYVEGQNILIEWRYAEDKIDRFPELAAELVRLKVDVIVAANAAAVGALKQATTTIPIVVATYGGDLVADGIVASFARPGGNITGVTPLDPELSGKQLELLKETLPKLSRLAVMWKPEERRCGGKRHRLLPQPSESNFYPMRYELQVSLTK